NIIKPELEEGKVKAYALIAGLTWQQDDQANYGILRRQAEVFKERLESIAGTEEVEILGDPDEEIIVEINPQALASYNLTVQSLSQQIAQSDSKIAAGQLRSNKQDLLIEVAGELDTLARIRQIPISFGDNGQFVNLQNVATIRKGITEPANELALINGYPGIAIAVHVESGQKLDLWRKAAQPKIAEFQSELPSSIGLPIIFDQSSYVEARLNNLNLNFLLGAVLVFGITVVMMGWRSALIVGTALPLSVLLVLGWMNWLNIPLHQMSITGLIIALGILIDNAIVMVDEMQTRLRQGMKAKVAITDTVRTLAIPLLSSTLTTVIAFLPIALLPGSMGEFVGAIAVTVIIAVSSSLFISLTIIPALTARLHPKPSRYSPASSASPVSSSGWLQNGVSFPAVTRLYQRSLRWTLAQPVLSIFLALLIPMTGFLQMGNLEQQFFPAADRDQLQIELELSSSASLTQTETLIKQIRQ
ncbi:MAG: efflux RND transporter permease subunit, partial [Waterburya sp.]